MFGFLLFLALVFIGFAVATQYANTDSGQSVPMRVWAAIVLAGSTLVAAVMQYIGQ